MSNNNNVIVDGNNFISHYLKLGKPLCAGKIGVTELNLMYCAHTIEEANRFQPHLQHEVEDIAGLYPYNVDTTVRFNDYIKYALSQVDLIPKWNKVNPMFENYVFENYCPFAKITDLQHLEPYFFDKPWTKYLDKKLCCVAVVPRSEVLLELCVPTLTSFSTIFLSPVVSVYAICTCTVFDAVALSIRWFVLFWLLKLLLALLNWPAW